MTEASYRFARFVLDRGDRQLRRDGVPVELNSRYLDALLLLVGAGGRLVSKERFLDEVWHGVPVTDEALTQCIKTLRRQLGDDAARPRFIETVPKHGYRFVAPVEPAPGDASAAADRIPMPRVGAAPWRRVLLLGGAGTLGAGVAGVLGGLFYGFAAAAQPVERGMGAVSVVLVLLIVTVALALAGGAGVAFGIAAADGARRRWLWSTLGGAAGGLVTGAVVKLVGLDALALLLGASPGDITGAPEGALLGGAVGLGCWLARRETAAAGGIGRGVALAALVGGGAGLLIPLLGGRLLGGSLALLARHVPASRLRLDPIGGLFGEPGFGLLSQTVAGGLEGALFAGCIAAAMLLARRRFALDG